MKFSAHHSDLLACRSSFAAQESQFLNEFVVYGYLTGYDKNSLFVLDKINIKHVRECAK